MGVGTSAETGLEIAVGWCVIVGWMSGLLIKGEFIVDEASGGVNGGFGTTGELFNDVFPLPSAVLEFPGCTNMVGGGSVCVLPLLATVWECTHDDKTSRNACG
jgi:hypothetical protein